MKEYTQQIIDNKQLLMEQDYLFFAYPKKGNKRYQTFIHRDEIFSAMKVGENGYIGNSDIKFSRLVSMDDIFTVVGLKRERKKTKKTSAASQSIADYKNNVNDVVELLKDHPDELNFFQGLTPGYKNEWARYLFSAKQQKTREKRHHQMVDILSQGYKSVDLYRQKKK